MRCVGARRTVVDAMISAEEFDSLYKDVRDRLLVEAYALTGDLAVSRTAVRDAFAVAWHHWNKVQRLDDKIGWLRPHVWRRARNRHNARPWHRERNLPEDVTATLEALNSLSNNQRKALTLAHLSPVPQAQMAREIGVTTSAVQQLITSATTDFSDARGCESSEISTHLEALRPATAGRWPRSPIIRRAGTARRRTHAVAGVMATVALVVASGTLVAQGSSDDAALSAQGFDRRPLKVDAAPLVPELSETALLGAEQLQRIDRGLTWTAGATHDNTEGNGLVLPCQRTSFADPDGLGAYVRPFTGSASGKKAAPGASAVQMVELSRTSDQAKETFRTASQWFTECTTGRTQLLSVHALPGVGDEARVITLRDWRTSARTLQVGLARTGQLTVTTVTDVSGVRPSTTGAASVLGAAVNALCGTSGSATCAAPPQAKAVAVPKGGIAPGMLSEFDLPPVTAAKGIWIGTKPAQAGENRASTRCDNTEFTGKQISHALTRTFLFTKPGRASAFGLTQTVGMTRNAKQARAFVDRVRTRIAQCADEPGTSVNQLTDQRTKKGRLTVWSLESEVDDENDPLRMKMAILQEGNTVSQVGFVPVGARDMSREDFTRLSKRAMERLPRLRLENKS